MSGTKEVARMVRWAAESMAFNLEKLPEDKLDWKPSPTSKSALDVVGEVVGVMRMSMPTFSGGTFEPSGPFKPTSLEEAKTALAEASAAFADALDAAGSELERAIPSPFGEMWASYAVTFGLIDLIHHHGQITYLQSLLGDAENHMSPDGIRWFAPPAAK